MMKEIAAQFGIELTDERAAELRDEAREFAEFLDVFEYSTLSHERVTEVDDGVDDYNAFRYRFEHQTGDGELSELEVGIKDNIAVAGVPMHCGAREIDFVPSYNATATSKLLESGATIVGTTNMDKLAYFTTGETCDFGTAVNPERSNHVAGGSSSGSGAAVAAGLVDAALGTDTGGSVRIPASFCGVVGFKPTYRSVSRFGFVDLAPSFDHIGTVATSVETAARITDCLIGSDSFDPSTYGYTPRPSLTASLEEPIDGMKVGLVENALSASNKDVSQAVLTATEELEERNCTVEPVSIPGYADVMYAFTVIESCEFSSLLLNNGQVYGCGTGASEEWRKQVVELTSTGKFGEHIEESLLINTHLLKDSRGRQYLAAQNMRRHFVREVRELFERYDALLTPTTPMTAPEHGEIDSIESLLETQSHTGPFNMTGQPAISVPIQGVTQLPVGLQVVTDWNDDASAVRLASAIEDIC